MQSKIPPLCENIYHLYADSTLLDELDFVDFHIRLEQPFGLRRFIRPQVNFLYDQASPFKPLPLNQSCAFFEWGLNWAIAQHAMQYLIIHSAVLEKDGKAIILPGIPGAGKSTLCAAMCHHGWRLLSDEQALICASTGDITPIARPICLKNESISIIKDLCPDAEFGTIVHGTSKGDLTHVKAPQDSLTRINETAKPCLIVFPQYDASQSQALLSPMTRGAALIELISHCFNYTTLGRVAFTTLSSAVANSECFKFSYNNLEQALAIFDQLQKDGNGANDPK